MMEVYKGGSWKTLFRGQTEYLLVVTYYLGGGGGDGQIVTLGGRGLGRGRVAGITTGGWETETIMHRRTTGGGGGDGQIIMLGGRGFGRGRGTRIGTGTGGWGGGRIMHRRTTGGGGGDGQIIMLGGRGTMIGVRTIMHERTCGGGGDGGGGDGGGGERGGGGGDRQKPLKGDGKHGVAEVVEMNMEVRATTSNNLLSPILSSSMLLILGCVWMKIVMKCDHIYRHKCSCRLYMSIKECIQFE